MKFKIEENLTISQLQSEIDKLSNKVSKEYSNVISNRDKINYLKEQLKKIKEEEKNKPIIDETEKKYLKEVIRPFKDKVECIRKLMNLNKDKEYISIGIEYEPSVDLPYFEKNNMYEGMETGKEYTLKELGLDE